MSGSTSFDRDVVPPVVRRSRRRFPRLLWILLGGAALLVAFLGGGISGRHDVFPFSTIPAIKAMIVTAPSREPNRYAFDRARLVLDEQKTPVPCPTQTNRTAVLLIGGQSNAGNHGGQRYASEYGGRIVNFFNGECFVAASPLLGASGITGEYWTQVANMTIGSGLFDQVVLAPAAITGTAVSRWAPGGDFATFMTSTVEGLERSNYRVTHVLWHQGEADYVLGTSEQSYRDNFLALVESLRARQIKAPIYVSVTSKCLGESNGGTYSHTADNPVSRAQLALPGQQPGLRSGINTDALLTDIDRYDDCHFGASGEGKVAKAWAELLASGR